MIDNEKEHKESQTNTNNTDNTEEHKEEKVETVEDRLNRKRIAIITAIAIAIFVFIFVSFFSSVILPSTETTTPTQQQTNTQGQEKSIAPKVEEDWKSITDMKINKMEEEIKALKDTNQQILQLLQESKSKEKSQTVAPPPAPAPIQPPPPPVQPPPPPPATVAPEKVEKPKPSLKEFKPEEQQPQGKEEEKKESKDKENKETAKTDSNSNSSVKIKLPIGFLKGLTLTGLDAPSFQYGQNNPHPILMVSLSKEILANNKSLNLKECFFLGSGFGEISSERAYVRLVKISCIDKKGKVIEQEVSGWVVDDDGKIGLKGRVVSKQGAILAKTFMAGLLEGLSRTIAASSTTIQISPIGTTQTIKPEDVATVAAASGFQSAASRLAQFYMKIAEQMYPVVEVAPGRKITILLQGGTLEKKNDAIVSNILE